MGRNSVKSIFRSIQTVYLSSGLVVEHNEGGLIHYIWDNENNIFSSVSNQTDFNRFLNDVKDSLCYLKNGSIYAKKIIDELSGCDTKTIIKYTKGSSCAPLQKKNSPAIIYFQNNDVLKLNEGEDSSYLSGALGLFHELYHAYEHNIKKVYKENLNNSDVESKYKNKAEKNAVEATNRVAYELGEPIRLDYISARPVPRYYLGKDATVTTFRKVEKNESLY